VQSEEFDAGLRRLAERQHGAVGVVQARMMAPGRAAYRSQLRSRNWVRESASVLRLAGSPRTFSQHCMVAALDAGEGSAVSHLAAAALWEVPGFSPGEVHVSRARGRSGRKGGLAIVHEPRLWPDHHRTVRDGIPVTTVARTVFDLAGCVHPLRAERALDNALAHKLVGLREVRAVAIELFEHGRTGSALMRRLLDDRGAGYIAPASGLEARFFALLAAAGLDLPERQVELGGDAWAGRVDFYFRRAGLVVEIDSERHHTAQLDAEADARRDAAMRAAGFRVLRIGEVQLEARPWEVVALVRNLLSRAA
jgi:hypothetical protein